MLNSLCTVPVGLVVEVSPSWHQAVKPEPGSPAPELWVQPGCQADPHSFHLQTKLKGWVQVHTSPGFSAMSFALAQEAAIDWQRIAPLQKLATWSSLSCWWRWGLSTVGWLLLLNSSPLVHNEDTRSHPKLVAWPVASFSSRTVTSTPRNASW